MSFRARQPGCACCTDDCLIPLQGWEPWTLPVPTIVGNTITFTSPNGLTTAYPAHPEGKSTHVVEVTVRGEDDGDILRVVVTFFDDDNYLYAEIEVGTVCGYLRLFQVTGGSTFQLGDDVPVLDLAPAEDHAVKVCYDGEDLTAIVTGKASYSQSVVATGEYVGVATGAITTQATFTTFRWWIHYDDGGYYGEPNNCPLCTMPCDIYADDFDRADSSDLGCTWINHANASIASSSVNITSNGQVICKVPNPIDGGWHVVQVLASLLNNGDALIAIVDYLDASNYHYAKLTIGTSASLEIFKVTGGVGARIGTAKSIVSTAPTLGTYLYACAINGIVQAVTEDGQGIARATTLYGGNQSGFGWDIGSPYDGNVTSFYFGHHETSVDGCSRCTSYQYCLGCTDEHAPESWKVVIQGVKNGTSSDCDAPNGTWILPWRGTIGRCHYYLSSAARFCGIGPANNDLELEIFGTGRIKVWFRFFGLGDTGTTWYFELPAGTIRDCASLSDEELNRVLLGTWTCCDFTESTCRITAL